MMSAKYKPGEEVVVNMPTGPAPQITADVIESRCCWDGQVRYTVSHKGEWIHDVPEFAMALEREFLRGGGATRGSEFRDAGGIDLQMESSQGSAGSGTRPVDNPARPTQDPFIERMSAICEAHGKIAAEDLLKEKRP